MRNVCSPKNLHINIIPCGFVPRLILNKLSHLKKSVSLHLLEKYAYKSTAMMIFRSGSGFAIFEFGEGYESCVREEAITVALISMDYDYHGAESVVTCTI